MTKLKDFIRKHREDIDAIVRQGLNRPDYKLNDEMRTEYVLRDEGLRDWARDEGCLV